MNKFKRFYRKKIQKAMLTYCFKDNNDIQLYLGDMPNSCGCGSNCYHFEHDTIDNKTYAICNRCDKDLFIMKEKDVLEQLKNGRWVCR